MDEVIAIAMTIGAHKARLMAEKSDAYKTAAEEQQPSETNKPFT